MAETEDILIYSFKKNKSEEVRISLSCYKGSNYIDFRVYYRDDDGAFKPSRQGIMLSLTLFPSFLQGIGKVEQKLQQENKNFVSTN